MEDLIEVSRRWLTGKIQLAEALLPNLFGRGSSGPFTRETHNQDRKEKGNNPKG